MSTPKIKTIKRLFALSGNLCAFPNCKHKLIDKNTGKILGEICHIKAQNTNGPRFDSTLTDTEVNAFENLILLCPLHHAIIDSDIESYTVERLHTIKSSHELKFETEKLELDDDFAIQFVQNISISNTIVFESNQLKQVNPQGGQYAQTIQNFNSPLKFIDNESYDALLTRIYDNNIPLSQLLAETIKIAKNSNENDLIELCSNELSGWAKKELPKYRMAEVYISQMQIKSVNFFTSEELWIELDSREDFVKKEMFFPLAVPLLESSVKVGKHLDHIKSYIHLTQKQGNLFPQMPNPEMTVHIYTRGTLYFGLLDSVRINLANEILKRV